MMGMLTALSAHKNSGYKNFIRCENTQFQFLSLLCFFSSVSMAGKAALVTCVYLIITRPWPAAKLRFVIVVKCLMNFFFGIHHKGSVLHHRFVNGFSLQQ